MTSDRMMHSARAQLQALADAAGSERSGWGRLAALPVARGSRAAAVLMLFGVLDSLPSKHRAQAEAVRSDLDVLMLVRAWTLRSNPGQVAFPGGRIDPEDSGPVEAAMREAREETGIDPAGVDVLGSLESVPFAYSRHLVTPVLAWWRHPSAVRVVDFAESAAVFRAPVADLLDPANRGVTVVRRDGQEWRGPGFLLSRAGEEARLVWGFTAMLLDGLFDRLGWTEPWDDTRELPLGTLEVDPSVAARNPLTGRSAETYDVNKSSPRGGAPDDPGSRRRSRA